jgi:intracellular septation protein A
LSHVAESKRPPSALDMLRDRRAMLDTGLGPVAFVTVNALTDLNTAAIVAIAISVVVSVFRAVRREPLTNAIGGLFGTGLAVFLALRTGSVSGYFLPRLIQNTALALVFAGSVIFRRPVVGFIVAPLYHLPAGWYREPLTRRACAEVTLAWALLFATRAIFYTIFIATDREGALAATAVVLGWPAFLGLAWFSYRYVPYRLRQLGVEPTPPAQ